MPEDIVGQPSALVSNKAYQLIIEGMVPVELADLPPEQIAAVIINGFTVNLGVSGTVVRFNCKLLQHIPQQNTGAVSSNLSRGGNRYG